MNRTLAITISPPPRNSSTEFLYNNDIYVIRRWLNKFSKHYLIYPEFDLSSRLHYHGVVRVEDFTKLHKTRHSFSRTLGYVVTKPLKESRDNIAWLQYCKKNYGECPCDLFMYKRLKRGTKPKNTTGTKSLLDFGIILSKEISQEPTNPCAGNSPSARGKGRPRPRVTLD